MSGLLSLRALSLRIAARDGVLPVLDRVSFEIGAGEIVGLIGESGSGKSLTAAAVTGLLPGAAQLCGGQILFQGRDLLTLAPPERAALRGAGIGMVFQNPRAALNPLRRVGAQIADVLARHHPAPAGVIRAQVAELLEKVRINDPGRRASAFAHELSGGQCQRIGIAIALAAAPQLLIADEPTTGLDVMTEAAIMTLIRGFCRARGMGVLLITHDLALAADYCDRLVILHAGQVVETAPAPELLARPRHPYSAGLLAAAPALAERLGDLRPIPGAAPDLRSADLPPCRFAPRCPSRVRACDAGPPELAPPAGAGTGARTGAGAHLVACKVPL